jgi:hypothetical protein
MILLAPRDSNPVTDTAAEIVLVAPQGTTRHENKGDVVFFTIFPKSFPKRNLVMCIPVYCTSPDFFGLLLCNRTKLA